MSESSSQPGLVRARGPAQASLLLQGDGGRHQTFPLADAAGSLTLGRASSCDISLPWDSQVSRLHAQLERIGDDWTVVDDGLSRNGTFVNGDRLSGRHRLRNGDTVRVGRTCLVFSRTSDAPSQATMVSADPVTVSSLSASQRLVLTALCRPYRDGSPYATPATNQQIAGELFLSVDAVKTHLRALFQKLHIDDLPHNQKRAKLVERAFQLGLVNRRDL